MLGSLGSLSIVLALMVFILIGLLHDLLKESCLSEKEGLLMKTKTKKIFAAIISILNSVWTVCANLLTEALLT